MPTEQEFALSCNDLDVAHDAAYAALNAKLGPLTAQAEAAEAAQEATRVMYVAVQQLVANAGGSTGGSTGGNTGGSTGGGTGGTVTTSPTLQRIINGFQKGFATTAQFPWKTLPVYAKTTQEGQFPPMPGTGLTYMSHAISTVGDADHYAVTKDFVAGTSRWNWDQWSKAYPEEQVEQSNDGSQKVYWRSQKSPGGAGEWDSLTFGTKVTGTRYFSLSGRVYNNVWFECDDKFIKPNLTFSHNAQHWTYDLETAGEHKIIVHCAPDMVLAGFGTQPGATIAPYDFMASSFSTGYLADSYGQGEAFGLVGMCCFDINAALMGAKAYRGSVYGGSGYARRIEPDENGNYSTQIGSADVRLNHLAVANVDMPQVRLGINDGWPTDGATGADVRTAMRKVYRALRAPNPDNVLVVFTPWCPRESDGNTPDSRPQQMGAAMYAELQALGGKWVLIDSQLGKWINSKGVSSQAEGPWFTGDGYVGAPPGTGNTYTYIREDRVHPTPEGNVYFETKAATYIKAAVLALV